MCHFHYSTVKKCMKLHIELNRIFCVCFWTCRAGETSVWKYSYVIRLFCINISVIKLSTTKKITMFAWNWTNFFTYDFTCRQQILIELENTLLESLTLIMVFVPFSLLYRRYYRMKLFIELNYISCVCFWIWQKGSF